MVVKMGLSEALKEVRNLKEDEIFDFAQIWIPKNCRIFWFENNITNSENVGLLCGTNDKMNSLIKSLTSSTDQVRKQLPVDIKDKKSTNKAYTKIDSLLTKMDSKILPISVVGLKGLRYYLSNKKVIFEDL